MYCWSTPSRGNAPALDRTPGSIAATDCVLTGAAGISVAEIIIAVDEPIDATQCGGKENCLDDQKCLTHDLWATLNDRIFEYLESVTLRQLVDEQRAKDAGINTMHDMRSNGVKPAPVEAGAPHA